SCKSSFFCLSAIAPPSDSRFGNVPSESITDDRKKYSRWKIFFSRNEEEIRERNCGPPNKETSGEIKCSAHLDFQLLSYWPKQIVNPGQRDQRSFSGKFAA